MIVVDTSVWIDYFAGRGNEPHVVALVGLIDDDTAIALTDVVLTEVLQGLGGEAAVERVESRLAAFEILRLESLDDFRRAGGLYRDARRQGVTVRKTLDCLIAAVCVRERCAILHNDRDFDRLAETTDLVVFDSAV